MVSSPALSKNQKKKSIYYEFQMICPSFYNCQTEQKVILKFNLDKIFKLRSHIMRLFHNLNFVKFIPQKLSDN